MMIHVKHAATSYQNVVVNSEDTDVFVILLSLHSQIPTRILLRRGKGNDKDISVFRIHYNILVTCCCVFHMDHHSCVRFLLRWSQLSNLCHIIFVNLNHLALVFMIQSRNWSCKHLVSCRNALFAKLVQTENWSWKQTIGFLDKGCWLLKRGNSIWKTYLSIFWVQSLGH